MAPLLSLSGTVATAARAHFDNIERGAVLAQRIYLEDVETHMPRTAALARAPRRVASAPDQIAVATSQWYETNAAEQRLRRLRRTRRAASPGPGARAMGWRGEARGGRGGSEPHCRRSRSVVPADLELVAVRTDDRDRRPVDPVGAPPASFRVARLPARAASERALGGLRRWYAAAEPPGRLLVGHVRTLSRRRAGALLAEPVVGVGAALP